MYKYNVSGTNGTCLLASMGLQLNITYKKKDNTVGSAPRALLSWLEYWYMNVMALHASLRTWLCVCCGQPLGTQP